MNLGWIEGAWVGLAWVWGGFRVGVGQVWWLGCGGLG